VARIVVLLAVVLFACSSAHLYAESITLEDPLGQIDESVLTNLDLPSLMDFDDAQLQAVCRELAKRFQGEYVLELAPLRDAANAALPLLEQDRETQPYAAWLRTRMDYLAVADELQVRIPPPSLELQPLPVPPANPTPDAERSAWREHLKREDLPPAARLYVRQLKPVFIKEGVPAELVWLAEVESRFEPQARSHVGAAGLFQLMPDTAQLLGLSVSPRDERIVPTKSAQAAAQYLKYLYEKFGDWRLAIAAYNAGEGRVRRLLDQYAARSYDEIASRLPAETQMYVPKVEATILRREGVSLGELKASNTKP
jgi:peptidoglycan lytic transglycosylase D